MIKNVALLDPIPMTAWRRISMGSWRPTGDSSVFVELDLEFDQIEKFMRERGLGINPVMAKLIGKAIATSEYTRRINSIVRFGRIYPRRNVDLFFHAVASSDDLSGVKLHSADSTPLAEIGEQFSRDLEIIRKGVEPRFAKVKRLFSHLPGAVARLALDVTGFLSYTLNLNLAVFGVPRDAFGSVMVTNVGSLGIDGGFTVMAPYTRIPCVIAICAARRKPIVENEAVVIRTVVRLGMSFDHRIVDGFHISHFVTAIKELARDPRKLEIST